MKKEIPSSLSLDEMSNDRLVYGITHDFSNLVTQIYTNLEVILLDKDLSIDTKKSIENAIYSLDQAVELLEKLNAISRPITQREQFIDPVRVIFELINKIEGTSSSKFLIENLINEQKTVKIDKVSFSRVIENIVDNAVFAGSFSDNPSVYIQISQENDKIKIVIEDSGEGIPSHLVNFIFNPYFTTKKNNIGSGVGLSISKSIVESVNGRLFLTPEKIRLNGASFTIEFPANLNQSNDKNVITQEFRPEDLANKQLLICAEDKTIKNHLHILHKLKAECTHFSVNELTQLDFNSYEAVILSLSKEVVEYGIVKLVKKIPLSKPILIISSDLESSSFLSELQRPNMQILDLPITFNTFAKSLLKLIFQATTNSASE